MSRVLDLLTAAHGQCRLTFVSATQLLLAPHNGRNLIINGALEQLPSGGVTVSNAGLAASTVYYVYARMLAGSVALELSTTGHTAVDGIRVKTGDATRTLVGMAYTSAGSQFQDGGAVIGVLSYFNRRRKAASGIFTAIRSTSSTTATELSSEIRCTFLLWSDEMVRCRANGGAYVLTSGPGYLYIGIDTNSQSDSGAGLNVPGSQVPFSAEYNTGLVAGEGSAHFATIYGIAASGGSVNMTGNATQAAGQRTSLQVMVMG